MSRRQPSFTDRQSSPSPVVGESPVDNRGDVSEQPSSSSPHRASEGSEGYPSWLPKRPLHPPPASTIQSSSFMHPDQGPSNDQYIGGRKPTPRSVRIVSLQDSPEGGERDRFGRREPTDQTRVSNLPLHARVWSRAAATGMSPSAFSTLDPFLSPAPPQPRLNSTGLRLDLLRNPSPWFRLYYFLLPLFVFTHIILQTFLDFNAVFILFDVAKFPSPQAPGVPGSGRNWTLGAAAYVACWFTWLFFVCILYEFIYAFTRRWRIRRPYILPIYLSSSAFNYAAMTSYSVFSFLQHVRFAAFFGESGSFLDGLAETFWFYSQNLPTVALLLPRAGLSMALLFAFSRPQPGLVVLANAGIATRDHTYFQPNGALTAYARGVLIFNAAWTGWRTLVLLTSWLGLWILSGHGCGGICGPRHRWEEEAAEKTAPRSVVLPSEEANPPAPITDAADADALPWSWKQRTRARIQDAYEFCLTVKPPRWPSGGKREASDGGELLGPNPASVVPFEGVEQILAAVGLGSSPPPARRGVLSEDLFVGPARDGTPLQPSRDSPPIAGPSNLASAARDFSEVIPKVVKRTSKEISGPSAPLMSLPYPFTGRSAQVSSKDNVPFPPSPVPSGEKAEGVVSEGSGSGSGHEDEEEIRDDEEVGDVEGDEEEADDDGIEGDFEFSEEPSSGRASGSMSSLGQPVISRYPFQFRRSQARAPSPTSSSPTRSHVSPRPHVAQTPARESPSAHSESNSTPSGVSRSTGNRESTDSQSPRSFGVGSSSGMPSPVSPTNQGSGIPMPPRHPQHGQGRGRARAGTAPSSVQMSPESVVFPRGSRTHARTATETSMGESFAAYDSAVMSFEDDSHLDDQEHDVDNQGAEGTMAMEQPEPEEPHEDAEREDLVGLLSRSAAPSPHRRVHTRSGSRSGSGSRSDSHSGSSSSRSRSRTGSMSALARSRAQSLVQGIGAASRSSLDLVHAIRMRAQSSMARLEEDVPTVPGIVRAPAPTPGSEFSGGHSRSGSGSDAMTSSGSENYTFGHPLRTQWRRDEEDEGSAGQVLVPERIRVTTSSQGSRSNLSVSSPSERPSDRTISRLPTPERTLGPGGRVSQVGPSPTTSQLDVVSTAPASSVTPPATVEGATDFDSDVA